MPPASHRAASLAADLPVATPHCGADPSSSASQFRNDEFESRAGLAPERASSRAFKSLKAPNAADELLRKVK